jgi:hypothetical protein
MRKYDYLCNSGDQSGKRRPEGMMRGTNSFVGKERGEDDKKIAVRIHG